MICPECTDPAAEVIDSRQLQGHRYRRYRCPTCQTRFSTGEFVVAVGNRTGGHPVEKWLTKLRAQGAAQLIEKLDALLTPWRQHGPPKDEQTTPEGIRLDPVEKSQHDMGSRRLALEADDAQRPDDRRVD